MLLSEYQSKRDEIFRQYNALDPFASDDMLRRFIIFSANLGNFMPECPWSDHPTIFKRICTHQRLSKLDQQDAQFLDKISVRGWKTSFVDTLKRKPGIICTFHTGSYRIINQLLARAGLPFTLVVSNTVLEREGDAFIRAFQSIKSHTKQASDFDIINAEMPNSMFKLMRAAKGRRNLVVYMDGNTGSGNKTHNDNQLCIDFFQDRLWARKGMAMLSFLLKLPIYPVLNRRLGGDALQFSCYEAIQPIGREGRKTYVKRTVEQLYGYLADHLKDDPAQWECWLYLHLHRVMEGKETGKDERAGHSLEDRERWGMFPIKENRFLLDKRTYNTYNVSKRIYDSLYNDLLAIYLN